MSRIFCVQGVVILVMREIHRKASVEVVQYLFFVADYKTLYSIKKQRTLSKQKQLLH